MSVLGEIKSSVSLWLWETSRGEKRLLSVEGGYRESSESWRVVFRDLIQRGLSSPHLIIGDGALGLWSAIEDMLEFASSKGQRCWVHKIANVLDKLPKKLWAQAESLLHEMMNADRESVGCAFRKVFKESFEGKYPKTVDCLVKDWEKMIPFFSFPGAHWQHIRTTNPIESTFATVKLRTRVMKGSGSKETAEAMAFKLMMETQKRWRKTRGCEEPQNILAGAIYKDGERVEDGTMPGEGCLRVIHNI